MIRLGALTLFAVLAAAPLAAAGYPDGVPGADVGRIVRAALERAGVAADMADPLRPFPPCDTVPTVTQRGKDWATAELTCPAPRWSRAIRTGATGAGEPATKPPAPAAMAVTLGRSLPKGAVVTAADLVLQPVRGLSPDQSFRSVDEVAGRRLKAALGAGKPVLQRHMEPRWLVEAGKPVVLVAGDGVLQVAVPAEAVEPGLEGDVVRVLNPASGREVKAMVTGPNRVVALTNIR